MNQDLQDFRGKRIFGVTSGRLYIIGTKRDASTSEEQGQKNF